MNEQLKQSITDLRKLKNGNKGMNKMNSRMNTLIKLINGFITKTYE